MRGSSFGKQERSFSVCVVRDEFQPGEYAETGGEDLREGRRCLGGNEPNTGVLPTFARALELRLQINLRREKCVLV